MRRYPGIGLSGFQVFMPGANLACRAGGGDMVYNTPMYTHIRRLPKEAGVNAVEVPMREEGLHYTLDF